MGQSAACQHDGRACSDCPAASIELAPSVDRPPRMKDAGLQPRWCAGSAYRRQTAAGREWRQAATFFGDVPGELARAGHRTLRVLREILEVTLAKFSVTFSVSRSSPPMPPVLTDVTITSSIVDLDVLLLAFAGLAHQQRASSVCALPLASAFIRALRRAVDVLGERDVLEVGLAGAAAATRVGGAGLRHAPAPGQHVDVALRALHLVAESRP